MPPPPTTTTSSSSSIRVRVPSEDRSKLEWEELEEEEEEEQKKRDILYPAHSAMRDVVRSVPGEAVLPRFFASSDVLERIRDFEVRPTDVWIVTYPKSGTTLTQEIVWQLMHGLDFEEGQAKPLHMRSAFLEFEGIVGGVAEADGAEEPFSPTFRKVLEKGKTSVRDAARLPDPRIIKTHLPLDMLPPRLIERCHRVVYVTRNPLDVCVSFYHHEMLWPVLDFRGSLDDYSRLFRSGSVLYGCYWRHLRDCLRAGRRALLKDKFVHLWYEDLVSDLPGVITRLARDLDRPVDREECLRLVERVKFDNFRKNEALNYSFLEGRIPGLSFCRKGQVGDWQRFFSKSEVDETFFKWSERRKAELGMEGEEDVKVEYLVPNLTEFRIREFKLFHHLRLEGSGGDQKGQELGGLCK